MDLDKLFWNASVEDLKRGYIYDEKQGIYCCLICGKIYEQGTIYAQKDAFYDAQRSVMLHIQEAHQSPFHYLLSLNQRLTGLTDVQKDLMHAFYLGLSDKEILKRKQEGSLSTIRNHRFKLKEKEKQAKLFLAMMELLADKNKGEPYMTIPRTTTLVDERFNVTQEEYEEVLKNYIVDGKLSTFPSKEKRKAIILTYFVKLFKPEIIYTEKEVNAIIKAIYDDYVTIRRYLIEYGYLDRLADGSQYWLNR